MKKAHGGALRNLARLSSWLGRLDEASRTLAKAMELAGSTEPQQVRAKMGEALKSMDPKFNLYSVQGMTENGGFITPTTMAVVEGGKIVRKEIE